MKEKLQKIREEAVRQIEEAKELNALNDVRVSVLGKKGELTAILKGMKDVSPEDRKRSDRRNITGKTEFCRTSSSEYDRIRRSRAYFRRHGL